VSGADQRKVSQDLLLAVADVHVYVLPFHSNNIRSRIHLLRIFSIKCLQSDGKQKQWPMACPFHVFVCVSTPSVRSFVQSCVLMGRLHHEKVQLKFHQRPQKKEVVVVAIQASKQASK